jgi:hypothetical protein
MPRGFLTQRRKGAKKSLKKPGRSRDSFAQITKPPHRRSPKEAQKTERFSGVVYALLWA